MRAPEHTQPVGDSGDEEKYSGSFAAEEGRIQVERVLAVAGPQEGIENVALQHDQRCQAAKPVEENDPLAGGCARNHQLHFRIPNGHLLALEHFRKVIRFS